jgi:inosine-uridine nucleoside N-ribohydrolase
VDDWNCQRELTPPHFFEATRSDSDLSGPLSCPQWMKRVVLDMDPGIDDAMVLLLALNSPKLDVAAITTVSGNVNLRKGTANALRLVEAVEKDIPVYMGAEYPAGKLEPIRAESIHGRDGLGDAGMPRPKRVAEKKRAIDFFKELLESSRKKEIAIVATGPLTNIAQLVQSDPALVKKIDSIFLMGGLYDPTVRGNVTEYAEFNFFSDPDSADKVFNNSGTDYPRITAVGLELTSLPSCVIDGKSLAIIRGIGSKFSDVAGKILNWPVLTYSYFNLHDVFALFAFVHPQIFTTETCSVKVAHSGNFRGRCTVTSGKGSTNICRKVNAIKFNQLVLDGLKHA